MPSGGPRPNSGRPRSTGEGWVTTSIVIRPVLLAAVDKARGDMSRSAWICQLIRAHLEHKADAEIRKLLRGD